MKSPESEGEAYETYSRQHKHWHANERVLYNDRRCENDETIENRQNLDHVNANNMS